ncbi:MAG: DUF2779 domain-containing protein, partial [Eggerthellaceae bacterium]|nr:DUF2779 domain-containing protein [Eggerthellaceae bacterium]
MRLSKSRYTQGVQCPKILWMENNHPEIYDPGVKDQAVLDTGSEVGDLAMGYFGKYFEIPFDGNDFEGMSSLTENLIKACVYEYGDEVSWDAWPFDMADARHTIEELTEEMKEKRGAVEKYKALLKKIADSNEEPVLYAPDRGFAVSWDGTGIAADSVDTGLVSPKEIGPHCSSPYPCGYRSWCWADVESPGVFDLARMSAKKKFDLYDRGIASFRDVIESKMKLSAFQDRQVKCFANGADEIIDEKSVEKFLEGLEYPLAFLDFETFQNAIPPFDGASPFEQIASQYSLHVLESPDSGLKHFEYLGAGDGKDPRHDLAISLAKDLPETGSVIAYNMSFEKTILKGLAGLVPEVSDKLLSARERARDLMKPFQSGDYYASAMGSSCSIKAVLPALFPGDPELDYHSLEGIHNGTEAMNAYCRLSKLDDADAGILREQL